MSYEKNNFWDSWRKGNENFDVLFIGEGFSDSYLSLLRLLGLGLDSKIFSIAKTQLSYEKTNFWESWRKRNENFDVLSIGEGFSASYLSLLRSLGLGLDSKIFSIAKTQLSYEKTNFWESWRKRNENFVVLFVGESNSNFYLSLLRLLSFRHDFKIFSIAKSSEKIISESSVTRESKVL